MNIDFELYRLFYVVAKNENISKAADELHISQPAISKSIKKLEDSLGGKLFVRTKKGVKLTAEGLEFYKYISQAIEYIGNAENKFTELINLETGLIKIGTSTTLTKEVLMPYIESFHEKYPKIRIEIITNTTNILLSKLNNGLVDVVVVNLAKENYSNDLEVRKIKEIEDSFITNDKLLATTPISIKDINNYPLILQSKNSNAREYVDNFALSNGVILKPSIELSGFQLVVEFTRIGFGIGYATVNYIEKYLNEGKLYKIKLKESIPKRHIGVITSKKHLPNFSTKRFVEILTKKTEN